MVKIIVYLKSGDYLRGLPGSAGGLLRPQHHQIRSGFQIELIAFGFLGSSLLYFGLLVSPKSLKMVCPCLMGMLFYA